jgi:hypothetical protein
MVTISISTGAFAAVASTPLCQQEVTRVEMQAGELDANERDTGMAAVLNDGVGPNLGSTRMATCSLTEPRPQPCAPISCGSGSLPPLLRTHRRVAKDQPLF